MYRLNALGAKTKSKTAKKKLRPCIGYKEQGYSLENNRDCQSSRCTTDIPGRRRTGQLVKSAVLVMTVSAERTFRSFGYTVGYPLLVTIRVGATFEEHTHSCTPSTQPTLSHQTQSPTCLGSFAHWNTRTLCEHGIEIEISQRCRHWPKSSNRLQTRHTSTATVQVVEELDLAGSCCGSIHVVDGWLYLSTGTCDLVRVG